MNIVLMHKLNKKQLNDAAIILSDSLPNGWPTPKDAHDEIKQLLKLENNYMIAAVEKDIVLGWAGILEPIYNGNVVELHPLVVKANHRGQGIGKTLVLNLENEAKNRGCLTIYLGSDDETEPGETSLAHVDLYADLPYHIKNFKSGRHPSGFYLHMGYKIIGVMPDANGIGKPDIMFGKRLK